MHATDSNTPVNKASTFMLQPSIDNYCQTLRSLLSDEVKFKKNQHEIESLLNSQNLAYFTFEEQKTYIKVLLVLTNKEIPSPGKKAIELLNTLEISSVNTGLLWISLGIAFTCGATYKDLPKKFIALFRNTNNTDSITLAVYCHTKVVVIAPDSSFAWMHLGYSFQKNGIYENLPIDFLHELLPKNLSSLELAAFCFAKSLTLGENESSTWNSLTITYAKDAKGNLGVDYLPEGFKTKFALTNYNFFQIIAFCSAKTLYYDPNNTIAWHYLALMLGRGRDISYFHLPKTLLSK